MMGPPPEATRLLEERAAARKARDFARADLARESLRRLGWRVVDGPQGSVLQSLLDEVEILGHVKEAKSRLGSPDTADFSLCVAMAGWPEDVRRLLAALNRGGNRRQVEVLVVDQNRLGVRPRDLAEPGQRTAVRVLRVEADLGHAEAWTVAGHLAEGRVLVFVEPSLEFGGDVLAALEDALSDPAVGLAGPFGLNRRDEHHFDAAQGPEVDALEYLLAMRRADFSRVGDFDSHYRFYRILDIDYSHQVAASGLRVRAVPCPEIRRHEHRLWASTPEAERERLSRRNFNRYLDRWVRASTAR